MQPRTTPRLLATADSRRGRWIRRVRPALAGTLALIAAIPPLAPVPAAAQAASAGVPGFWDPRRRPERPDLGRISLIRFMTEVDYPPFDYAGPDGNPTGFNVELARAMCEELHVTCTVQ